MRKLYTRARLIRLQINFINPHHHSTLAMTEERMWIYALPAVWGQWLGVGPALSLLSGLTPLPGNVIVVVRTVVHLWLPASATVSIWSSFIAVHCPGAGYAFQDLMVFAIGRLWRRGSLVGRGCGGRGGGGGGGGMLGHLVSMRDEEVLHTVHGRICLCWCFTFVSVLWLMFSGEEGRSVVKASLLLLLYMRQQDHWHSSTAEAITGKKKKQNTESAGWHEVNKGDSKSIIHAIHAQLLSWVLTSTDSLQDGIKEKKNLISEPPPPPQNPTPVILVSS